MNAWCGGDARTKRTHHYDPKGRLRGYSETEIEENKRDDDKKDKKAQDHHQQMDAAYSAYDAELREAWRRS